MIFDEDEPIRIRMADPAVIGDAEYASFKAARLLRLRRDAGGIHHRSTKLS